MPPPIKVHKISFQSKIPLPGVKIVINSLHIKPNIAMQIDSFSLSLKKNELGLNNSGIITYNKEGKPIPGKKFGMTPRK